MKLRSIREMLYKYVQLALFLLCAVFAVGGTSAAAAEKDDYLSKYGYLETIYDNNNGLGSAAANAVVQTEEGFIWVGTYNGLVRYDGSTFYHYPVSTGVNSVADLFVDTQNRLWIGTNDSGVACYKGGEFTYWQAKDGLSSNIVRKLAQNDEGTIYVGTTKGVSIIKDGKAKVLNNPKLQRAYVTSLSRGLGNKVAGLTVKGDLFILKGEELESYVPFKSVITQQPTTICPDEYDEDTYWIGTAGNTVVKVKVKDNQLFVEEKLTATGLDNINCLYHYHGYMLVASDKGAGVFDESKRFHSFATMKMYHSIDKIMVDYEDNIWLASSRQGIAKLTKTRFRNIFSEANLPKTVVNSISEYQGVMYFATDSGLLAMQDSAQIENDYTKLLKGLRTRQTMVDSKNRMWVTTYSPHGLLQIAEDGTITSFNEAVGMPNNRVRVVMEAKDGTIYTGTRYGMAIIRDDKVVKTFTSKDGLTNPQVLCLLEDNGKIYAGTDGGGICIIENDKITATITEKDGLKTGVILRMTRDPDGKRIWISASNSIAYYEDGKLHNVPNFPSTNNFDFVFTPSGDMLITCNNGIYITTSEKMRADGGIVQLLTKRDGLEDSLTANSFNYVDKGDNLYLCLQSGVNSLNMRNMSDDNGHLRLLVPSINVDGKEIFFDQKRKLTLPSDITRLTFKGYILSNSLNNAMLQCYLEGFDKGPEIYSRYDNKEMTYTNLKGGTYTLHVGIYDAKSNKVIKEQTYVIEKEMAIHEYMLFWVGLFALAAGGVFLAVRTYWRKRYEAAKAKQKQTQEILDQVINSFATAIDLKDHYTRGHSVRVATYSRQLAAAMGLDKEQTENIYRIGLLHDVGKVIIPDEILNKKGPLTNEEYAVMKKHTDIGAEILSKIVLFPSIALGANTHHERYDGKGYGHKLAGENIPLEGRIIAVADCFDAMNSTRVYRPNLTKEKILEQLELARNTQLDGKIVDVLLDLIAKGEVTITSDAEKK